MAVERARAAGVPVSTIAYGSDAGSVVVQGDRVQVPVDAATLAALADGSGGAAYEAASTEELEQVYADLGSSLGTTTERREIGGSLAAVALLGAVTAAGAALAWSPRTS